MKKHLKNNEIFVIIGVIKGASDLKSKQTKEQKKVLALFMAIVLLLLIIFFSTIFYIRASRPMRQAKAEAIQLAQQHVALKRVDHFYWYTREETFFSLIGEDEDGKEKIIIIPKSGEKMTILDQSDGLDETEVRAIINNAFSNEKIKKITLGIFEGQVVWEVMTKTSNNLHYYLLDFKDGTLLKSIQSE